MNRLVITLLIVALASALMANWGMAFLFDQVTDDRNATEVNYEQLLGKNLAKAVANSNNPQATVRDLSSPQLQLSLIDLSTLELPVDLQQRLITDGFLSLASATEIIEYFPLSSTQALSVSRPALTESNLFSLQFTLTLLFYVCIAMAIVVWSRPLIKRLVQLRQTTRAFGEGDLQQRIAEGSSLYISDIEHEFNRMADRIETLIADNKLLSNAVSHDLKTPLARLRFGLDVLQETTGEEQRQKYLNKLSRDLQEMECLVDTLLCYARLDQAKLELHKDKVDLVEFIQELTTALDFGHIRLNWQQPTNPVWVEGDTRYLSLLINNLLTNACQHARHSVAINIVQTDNTVKLQVEDDGPGIPQAQRQAVLKPFVRGEEERSSRGHGMGLAIVNRIIHWHHWGLTLGDSKSLGGAQVEVTIS